MNIKKLDKHELEVLKLLSINYSLRRNEIYIHDFNDEMLFSIDLCDYDLSSFTYDLLTDENEAIPNNIYYYFDNEIIDLLESKYFETAVCNLSFKTFNVLGFKEDNSLYCIYFDYTYQLVFADDKEDALIKVSDMLVENGYKTDLEDDEILFNFIVKIEAK